MKLLAAVLLLLLAPAAALADVNAGTETVGSGTVSATLSWSAGEDGPVDSKLTIARGGVTAYDRLVPQVCRACDEPPQGPDEFTAADLDGDGEAEIVFNGLDGRECCALMDVFYFDGAGYQEYRHDFGSTFAGVADLDEDGKSEIIAHDTRFEKLFHGGSFLPLQILNYSRPDGGAPALRDVTRHFPVQVREEAAVARDYADFLVPAIERDEGPSVLGSYVADEFLLGRGDAGLRFLDKQAKRGVLGRPRTARRFRRQLLASLHRYGYR